MTGRALLAFVLGGVLLAVLTHCAPARAGTSPAGERYAEGLRQYRQAAGDRKAARAAVRAAAGRCLLSVVCPRGRLSLSSVGDAAPTRR